MTAYSRTIDYDANVAVEDFTRRRGNYPMRGGGAPFDGDQRVVQVISGGFAWNMQGEKPALPGRPYLEGMPHNDLRQLEIMLTPHGFLKAAMAAKDARVMSTAIVGPTNAGLTENGRRANIVTFTALGKYKVVGTINDQNLVELTTTWISNHVYGDMLYEIRHLNYKDFGGVKFPTTIHVHQGDPVFNPAHNMMEIRVSDVRTNVTVPAMPVPDNIRNAPAAPVRAEAQKVGDGVWFIGGGSHNSVAVEFSDYMAVIEAPLGEERSLAVLEAVAKLAPNKLVRYIINTHHHFDHSSGLRTYIAQGSTLVTHKDNADFYEHVMFSPAPRTADARPALDVLPELHGEPPSSADRACESEVRAERRQPDRRALSDARIDAHRPDAARVSAEAEDPGQCGHVHAARAGRADSVTGDAGDSGAQEQHRSAEARRCAARHAARHAGTARGFPEVGVDREARDELGASEVPIVPGRGLKCLAAL